MNALYIAEVEFVTTLCRTQKLFAFETEDQRATFVSTSETNRFTVINLYSQPVYLPGEAVRALFHEHDIHRAIATGTIAADYKPTSTEEVARALRVTGVSPEGDSEGWEENESERILRDRNRKDTLARAGIIIDDTL